MREPLILKATYIQSHFVAKRLESDPQSDAYVTSMYCTCQHTVLGAKLWERCETIHFSLRRVNKEKLHKRGSYLHRVRY
jgi:hypothetical protein